MRSKTPHPIKIAPSILTVDFGHLASAINAAEAGGADMIHLDIMDGNFVPNISFGPLIVSTVRKLTDLPLDVHLMLADPDRYLADFAEAGADILTVHVEACTHLHRTVQRTIELGCKAGVALNPATPVESIREISPFVDMVLVMTVNPGFGGQRFIETSTSKIQRMRALLDEYNPICDVEVDGGIGAHNIGDVIQRGANVIVAGSSVFDGTGDVAGNLSALRDGYAQVMHRARKRKRA
ncbi:MAG: ribulose-phosphate 3-epimerase [Caldilineaceae bacterium]|nr:ribulose-phosphate 3-epimerase [Caldilineaceae bacterium]